MCPSSVAPLLERYDTDPKNGEIDKSEVITAIRDYLRATPSDPDATSKADVIKLIRLFIRG